MKPRLLPILMMTCALALTVPLGGCQTTATADGGPGPNGWSGLVNPNKARDLASAAARAVRRGGSIIASNFTPAQETHEMAAVQEEEPDDPYIAACTVDTGTTSFAGGWMDFASETFTIRRGEEKNIALQPRDGGTLAAMSLPHHTRRSNPRLHTAGLNAGFWVTREKDGQNLVFCAEDPGRNSAAEGDCIRVVAMEDYLSHGFKRTLDIPGAVRGGTIECGYETPQFAQNADKSSK